MVEPSAAEVETWLAAAGIDAVADYIRRGRPLRTAATGELVAIYRAIWNVLTLAPTHELLIGEGQDIECELQLRRIALPELLDERAAVALAWTAAAIADPDRWRCTAAIVNRNIEVALHPGAVGHLDG